MELGNEGLDGFKFAGPGEFEEDSMVGFVGVAEVGVEVSSVVEYLEGKVEVLLLGDH